ncbi:MAG TPA: WYL domain-containing protein, partial [Rectinemataceae bacterium]|nr:WYL domain-containing protein [Rectinemataceae bacterium]
VIAIRRAIEAELVVHLAYTDAESRRTERDIWPFSLAYYDQSLVVMAWCEQRSDFRNFRVDRIAALELDSRRYPEGRAELLRRWQEKERIPLDRYEL